MLFFDTSLLYPIDRWLHGMKRESFGTSGRASIVFKQCVIVSLVFGNKLLFLFGGRISGVFPLQVALSSPRRTRFGHIPVGRVGPIMGPCGFYRYFQGLYCKVFPPQGPLHVHRHIIFAESSTFSGPYEKDYSVSDFHIALQHASKKILHYSHRCGCVSGCPSCSRSNQLH